MKELIEIQSSLVAPKDKKNTFGNYTYRSAEQILESVKPLLKKHSCTITISDDLILLGDRFYVKAIATIRNSTGEAESTIAFAREQEDKKGMDQAQVTGAASSYARKYALCGLLAIDDNKDPDTMDNRDEGKKPGNPEPPKVAAKPTVKPECPTEVWWKLIKMEVEGLKTKSGLTALQYLYSKYRSDKDILAKFNSDVQMARDARETQDFLDLDESNPKNI